MTQDSLTCIRVTSGPVWEVTIARPKALNALNRQIFVELGRVIEDIGRDSNARCLIITGEGSKAFVAGADIAEMSSFNALEADAFAGLGQQTFSGLESLGIPVIAAVNGFALGGGCELAMACDIIYAAETAKFGQPEVKLGLMPGFGGTARLPRKIGLAAASQWIFTGDTYSAHVARDLGLVQGVFAADELLPQVREIAQSIAKRAPLAVRAAKRVMVQEADRGIAQAMERWSFGQLFVSRDTREGTQAFLEKRDPNFRGE